MIHASWIVRVDNFNCLTLALLSMRTAELGHAVSFRNLGSLNSSISINPHGANM